MTDNTTGATRDPGNNIAAITLDDSTLEARRAFLESLDGSAGSPSALALDGVKAEQAIRAEAASADLEARRSS